MLSKLEKQETVLDKTEYRLDEQIRKCILMLENKWAPKNIEFDMELPRQTYYSSVLINLIDNAIKHSSAGSSIHIAICETSETVAVSISDDGDGMTEEVQKHIFLKNFIRGIHPALQKEMGWDLPL